MWPGRGPVQAYLTAMRTGSVALISRVRPHLTKLAMTGTGGGGIARTGAVGMLGPATGVLVGAMSMIGAHQ
uniref:Uncharacterized protein n=1 Tax=Romanomermis culicivorax TaxID=13658 RepID=A0A915HIH2_ROMCU